MTNGLSVDTAELKSKEQILYGARQILIEALENYGVDITGRGFGSGQADVDIKIGDRDFCISMTLAEITEDEELI
jgi:hypothetical protein